MAAERFEQSVRTTGVVEIVLDATSVANVVIPGGHMRMNEIACSGTLDGRDAILHVEMGWGETYAKNYTG